MMTLLILVSIGVTIAALVAFAVSAVMPGGDSTATEDRLQVLASRRPGGSGPATKEPSLLLAGGLDDTKNWFDELTKSMPALSNYLDQADVRITPLKFASIVAGCFVAGLVACLVSPLPILLAPFGGFTLAAVPVMWLRMKRNKRLSQFGNQLPEALELLARSLRAGHSLAAGFGLIASEMADPVSKEFGRAFEEQNFGIPLEEALQDMSDRVPNMDLRFFATAVILQRQTGGDLAEILDKISHLVRERIAILGQVQALTGEGRLSGIVLLAMPPVLFLVMLYMNYEYAMMLFTDPTGQKMMLGAIVTQVLGALVIRKIVTIKV